MRHIEEKITVPIIGKCDVLVAGGGIAGIAAALAAGRQGKDVLLIENEYTLGGLATLGLVTIYLPLCDGEGHQVIFGIGEELLRLSIKHGYEDSYPAPWLDGGSIEEKKKKRFTVRYNANHFALEAEKLLLDAGVHILYGSRVCSVNMDGDRISDVIVENKSGRVAYEVGNVVDCTGDADIAKFAGAETATFAQGNVLAAWYYLLKDGNKHLKMLGFSDTPDEDKAKGAKAEKPLISRRFGGLNGEELSEQTILSHAQTLADFKKKRESDKNAEIAMIATIPQIRMTRRIVGEVTPATSDERRYFEDSIGMTGDWRKSGPIYEIPFGAIKSANITNLLAAGRCISVTDGMWDITRVIPTCAVTGEAAGIAAAMFEDLGHVDINALQTEIRRNGGKLHICEVLD